MARPYKTGLDYFPLDVHLDDDIELFEAECGLVGYAILVKLWQKIYAEGYYVKWDNDSVILFAKRNNTEPSKIDEVINSCLHRNLFNNGLYKRHKILTSKAIQKRYFSACKDSKRKNISAIKEYLLVNGEYLGLITELIKLTPEETIVNTGESTQSKVKEIESKRKNKNIVDLIPESVSKNLRKAVQDYIEYRIKIKSPMTENAVSLLIKKLETLATDDEEKIQILNQSIINGWKGIFELKKDNHQTSNKKTKKFEEREYAESDIEDLYYDPMKDGQIK